MSIELLIILAPIALFILSEIRNNFGEHEGGSPETLEAKKKSAERNEKLLRMAQEHKAVEDELAAFKKK